MGSPEPLSPVSQRVAGRAGAGVAARYSGVMRGPHARVTFVAFLGSSRGDTHRTVRVAAVDHEPGGGGEVGHRVDQDEAARPAVALS